MGEDRGASAFVKGYSGEGGSPLDLYISSVCMSEGNRGSTVVKALCYKSEDRWFDPSWCQWIFH